MDGWKSAKLPIASILVFFLMLWIFGKFGPAIPFSINSVQTTKSDLFTVTGEGKATSAPNMAILNLGVQIQKATVKEAQSEANKVSNKITQDLKNLGIADKDITTSNYSIYPQYDYQSGSQRLLGYSVNINLTVKVHDLNKVDEAIDRSTAAGANTIGGLQFTTDDTLSKNLENEAREKAIKEAREKAQNMASAAGVSLGRIINIQENFGSRPGPIQLMTKDAAGFGGGPAPTNVQPGTSEVSLSVVLSYEIR